METIIETFSKSIEISVFPLRIKNNIKLIPKLFPKLDFKILVSPYTFGLSQPPIVPLSLFVPQSLRTTAGACARRRPVPPMGCAATAAQGRAQSLEVRELAELRRQRAVQVVPPHAPASAPRYCAGAHGGECPSR